MSLQPPDPSDPPDRPDAPDPPDSSDEPDIDLLAASLRADASDVHAFAEALAVKLEEALPHGVRVDRSRDGLFGPKRVGRIVVDAGDERLEFRAGRAGPEFSSARVSGGITLKTEAIDTDEWLRRLGAALAEQARRSDATRQALERLLAG